MNCGINLAVTLVFSFLLCHSIWFNDHEIHEVRYCCRENGTCIDRDVISASEIYAGGNSSHRFKVNKNKPCQELYNEGIPLAISKVNSSKSEISCISVIESASIEKDIKF